MTSLLGPLLVAAGCTGPQAEERPQPRPAVCTDPVYLELSREHPDSLSDRAWERLQQLEAACERERARAAGGSDVSVGRSGHHWGGWIWMPTMMVVGTLTWVLMGGGL